jgi:hypothetical protein
MGDERVKALLAEREKSHGEFSDHSLISQQLKDTVRGTAGWLKMNPAQREGLEMICHKIGRIVAGNPYEPDHWLDIQGYSALVHSRVVKPENTIEDDIKATASRVRITTLPYDESDPRN